MINTTTTSSNIENARRWLRSVFMLELVKSGRRSGHRGAQDVRMVANSQSTADKWNNAHHKHSPRDRLNRLRGG
jgi:hypothetical protein